MLPGMRRNRHRLNTFVAFHAYYDLQGSVQDNRKGGEIMYVVGNDGMLVGNDFMGTDIDFHGRRGQQRLSCGG